MAIEKTTIRTVMPVDRIGSTPHVMIPATSSRASRLTFRTISSSNNRSTTDNPNQPPIVLDVGSTVLRVGYAGESRPQHLIEMEHAIFDSDYHLKADRTMAGSDGDTAEEIIKRKIRTKTESEWYLILSPLIEQMYDRLMCKPSTRRIVCLYSNQRYTSYSFRKALQQHMWNRGVPAMVEMDQLQCLPIAQGWKRGLVVQISREESVCIVSADGQLLSYTYQMVPYGYKTLLESRRTNDKTEYVFPKVSDDNAPMPLVSAILACLTSCPRDLRLHVVSNIVFCGDGVFLFPDLPRRTVKCVRHILQNNNVVFDDTSNNQEWKDDISEINFARVPIDVTSLRSLSSSISLVSCAPYRADWVCFAGASLWVAIWNKYSDVETPIPWNYNTSEKP